MRKHNRLLYFSLLVSACFSVNALAQEAVSNGMWADSSTWSGGEIPQGGGNVTIGEDLHVVLESNTPELGSLTISRKLSFADNADLELPARNPLPGMNR